MSNTSISKTDMPGFELGHDTLPRFHINTPSSFDNLSREQLLYKLAELSTFIGYLGKHPQLLGFQKWFAAKVAESGDPITVDTIQARPAKGFCKSLLK